MRVCVCVCKPFNDLRDLRLHAITITILCVLLISTNYNEDHLRKSLKLQKLRAPGEPADQTLIRVIYEDGANLLYSFGTE